MNVMLETKMVANVQTKVPLLQSGDHLSRAEFERRYRAHPHIKHAELVEGVVYVSSPVRYTQHADPHFTIIGWLAVYQAATPGVRGGDNATLRLDFENETQPDALLRLEPAAGGQSVVTDDDYLEGAPELIVEIAASSASYDMHDKRRAYGRNGVREYLVFLVHEQRVVWFGLHDGIYEPLPVGEDGVIRSEVFPGLWLDVAALRQGALAQVLATLQQGLQTPEHAAFVAELRRRLAG